MAEKTKTTPATSRATSGATPDVTSGATSEASAAGPKTNSSRSPLSLPWLLLFWAVVLGALVGLLNLFQAILLPFVLGFLAAYFLNPAVVRLEARGLPRSGGTALVSIVFFVGFLLCGLFVLPALFGQMQDLLMRLPALVGFLWDELLTGIWPRIEAFALAWDLDLDLSQGAWQRELFAHVQDMAWFAQRSFRELLSGLGNVITLIGLLVLSPVIGIYFLYDYPSILKALEGLVPRRNLAAVRHLAEECDRAVSGLVRGLTVVALLLSVFYTIGFWAVGFRYALFLAVLGGLSIFVPYIGPFIVMVLGLGLAYFQSQSFGLVLLVLLVLSVGQFLEGSFLTPRLVGRRLGLHPLWLIFALLAGGVLAGFVGVMVALPAAAATGAVIRLGLGNYRQSVLYTAPPPPPSNSDGSPVAGPGPADVEGEKEAARDASSF